MQTFRYFSKIPGAKVIMPDGKELFFYHGFHDLKEEDYIGQVCLINQIGDHKDPRNGKPAFEVYKAELDALIKVGNPLLYIQGTQPEPLPKIATDVNAKSEAELVAANLRETQVGGKISGDPNKGVALGVNDSTIDPALQAAVLREKKNPVVEAARAAAAQRVTTVASNVPGNVSSNS